MAITRKGEVTVGDFGFKVSLDTELDLSATPTVNIRFRIPGTDVFVSKVAAIASPASSGVIEYTTLDADNLTLVAGDLFCVSQIIDGLREQLKDVQGFEKVYFE